MRYSGAVMTGSSTMRLLLPALAALSLVAGCHKAPPAANSLDAMDADLINGAVVADTPANRALGAAIRVDAGKARHGQPAMPAVNEENGGPGGGDCLGGLQYANAWAGKLPADLPMHPAAKLQEAAGHDGSCRVRIASFTVAGDRAQVMGWYTGKAKGAGYSTGRDDKGGDWILAGDKGDTAYYIIVGPPQGGETPVDYIWTGGQ